MRQLLWLPVLVGVLLCAGVFALYIYKGREVPGLAPLASFESAVTSPPEEAPKLPPEGWVQYMHEAQGFSMYHPPELMPQEYDEGSGTYTVTFEPKGGGLGFQIFFTPYLGDTITQSRLLKDIPLGEFTPPMEIVLGDGTRALTFESRGPLGAMREVWFLHGGYLFELTGYKELEAHVGQVIQNWRFK